MNKWWIYLDLFNKYKDLEWIILFLVKQRLYLPTLNSKIKYNKIKKRHTPSDDWPWVKIKRGRGKLLSWREGGPKSDPSTTDRGQGCRVGENVDPHRYKSTPVSLHPFLPYTLRSSPNPIHIEVQSPKLGRTVYIHWELVVPKLDISS